MFRLRSLLVILPIILVLATAASAQELTPLEQLGKLIFFDTNLSTPPGQSCATCHDPETGFTGPLSDINETLVVYPGAVHVRFGNRKPPTAAYGGDSPVLYYDEDEELFIGGMFWDGRATGWTLGDPLAEQAQGPFLNPLEQNNPNARVVIIKISQSDYADLFEEVWGPGSLDYLTDLEGTYERVARSISAYEQSTEVNPFTSKYDYYLAGEVELTSEEALGLELFNGDAMCSACHISEPGPDGEPPLFTDFTYDNLGVPKNYDLPFYTMPRKYNIYGYEWVDPGLGGFLAGVAEYADYVEENLGKQKVPTLRNVDKRPYPEFVKAYSHNGFFKSLEEIVNFYNTRDVDPSWPPPEVPENVNDEELGDLGLTLEEELAIVTFMKTLTDGYVLPEALAASEASTLALRTVNPNPFNPLTLFDYYLPQPGNIQLDVYNIRGQRVKTLVSGWQMEGHHQVSFAGKDLASGVYLARLVKDNQFATTKITLVK